MTHITNEQLLKRADDFIRGITKEDKVCIVHDTDPDGICAAVILAKAVEQLRGTPIELHLPLDKRTHGINPAMKKEIEGSNISVLITADFSLEQDLDLIKELENTMRILVVDHHKLYNKYESDRVLLYKPQLFSTVEPARYCTGKLAYDLASRVADVEHLDWMAAAACIADIATEPWQDWLKNVFKKYGAEWQDDLFRTKIGQVAATISSTEVYDVTLVPKCYDVFYQANKPEDILNSSLGKYKQIIDAELDKHVKGFEETAEVHGDLHIYEMSSPYSIQSPLSTILSLKHPHKTIIIINTANDFLRVSARRQDKKIPVNNLLEQAVKGFEDANAGGHAPAAGAGFPKRYLGAFKENLCQASE